MKKRYLLPLLLALSVCLSGCGQTQSAADTSAMEKLSGDVVDTSCVHGADNSGAGSVCVSEAGVFYIGSGTNGNLLTYYDYDANQNFVLCTKANCKHSGENCAAFVSQDYTIGGFAYYDGSLYLLEREADGMVFQLLQMDVNCENQTALAKLDGPGDSVSAELTDVCYGGGYAWIHLTYDLVEDDSSTTAQQLLAVQLSDGAVTELTELLYETRDGLTSLSFESITESGAVWYLSQDLGTPMSDDEYYEKNGTLDGYEAYTEEFYETVESEDSWWTVSADSMEPRQMDFSGLTVIGSYQGKWLCLKYGDTEGEEVWYTSDPETDETETLFTVKNGGCLARYDGEYSDLLYDGDKLLYMEEMENDQAQVSSYSLADGTSTPLFTDKKSITFRIVSETVDRLIGHVGESSDYVWIWKTDYEQGDWSSRVKILSGIA